MPGRATNEPSNYIAFGVQSAVNVEATTFFFSKHLDGSGTEIDEDVTTEREGGDGQEAGLRYKTAVKADGQVVENARPGALGRYAAWTLGVDAVSIIASPLTLHKIVPAATVPYLTKDERWGDVVERTTNNVFTSLELEAEAGGIWKVTANYISGGSAYERPVASTLTPSRDTSKPFFFPAGTYIIEGAANTKVTKVKIGANRNVDDDIFTTGLNREDVVPLNQDYDVDFTVKYEDRTIYRKVKYNSGSQVSVPFLATGAYSQYLVVGSQSLNLGMPLLEYVGAKVNKLDPDGKTMYLDVSAMTIKGATYPLWLDLITADIARYDT